MTILHFVGLNLTGVFILFLNKKLLQNSPFFPSLDKMNVVLLITVTFTLALVHGNNQPCQRNNNTNAYNEFVLRHILQESFNRYSRTDWTTYIKKYGLCNRPMQTFIKGRNQVDVVQTCNGSGRPLVNSYNGNFCISSITMHVYELSVNKNCRVINLVRRRRYVIVACDKVGNLCSPVYFEKYINQKHDMTARPCRP